MSKETTAVNVTNVLETLKANSGRKGSSKFKQDRVYTRVMPESVEGVRLAPQAIVLVGALLNASEDTWAECELFELVQKTSEELKTKQEPWKIFQYYRKAIIDAGFLKMEKKSSDKSE